MNFCICCFETSPKKKLGSGFLPFEMKKKNSYRSPSAMGGVLGRVADSYNDSDDEQPSLGVELEEANAARAGDAAIELPVLVDAAVPGSVSPLLFGGNVFPNGDPSNPINELMLPLLRRLASNTPQISHTRTVMCPFNVNKDSIKAVPRVTTSNTSPSTTIYDLQFTFDATEPCIVKVFVCVDETFSNGAYVCPPLSRTRLFAK